MNGAYLSHVRVHSLVLSMSRVPVKHGALLWVPAVGFIDGDDFVFQRNYLDSQTPSLR